MTSPVLLAPPSGAVRRRSAARSDASSFVAPTRPRYGIERIQQAATAKGGECLSSDYLGVNAKYRFRCQYHHEWDAVGNEVLRGRWCRQCAIEAKRKSYRAPDGLRRLQALAERQHGECLSTEYLGQKHPYRFRCAQQHEWETLGQLIINGAWCPHCAKSKTSQRLLDTEGLSRLQAMAKGHGDLLRLADGLEKLHAAAKRHDGACLSNQYRKQSDFYRFRCRAVHEWEARGGHVLRGQWCARCACDGRKLGIALCANGCHGTWWILPV